MLKWDVCLTTLRLDVLGEVRRDEKSASLNNQSGICEISQEWSE